MGSKVRPHVHTVKQAHNSRCFYNANVNVQSLFVSKEDWFTWFKQANAWRKVSPVISYAEVVKENVHNNTQSVQSPHCSQNNSKTNKVELKPSTPALVNKCIPKYTVVQHTVHRDSSKHHKNHKYNPS